MGSAHLPGADASQATLHFTNLKGAELSDASLFNAEAIGANFLWADTKGVDFRTAATDYSFFAGMAREKKVLSCIGIGNRKPKGMAFRCLIIPEDIRSPHDNIRQMINEGFGDASVVLPSWCVRPKHWLVHVAKDEHEYFASWRGWIEAMPGPSTWSALAGVPPRFRDIKPIPPAVVPDW